MSTKVLRTRLLHGVALMLRQYSQYRVTELETDKKGKEYIDLNLGEYSTEPHSAGCTTYRAEIHIDYYTNKRHTRDVNRINLDNISDLLGRWSFYKIAAVSYYFNGEVVSVQPPVDDEDKYAFRIIFQASHTIVF
jgi:hypothetical protein